MGVALDHIHGRTFHGRHGAIGNQFSYGIDYVLTDLSEQNTPFLFSQNKGNITAIHDVDHGGERGNGSGANWVREVIADQGFDHLLGGQILLLAQPRVFGHVFNPVCFWLVHDRQGLLKLVIAEVNNTFGDRHSYLCHKDDHSEITKEDRIGAQKIFHVSPFQDVSGKYTFRFDINADAIGIWIDFKDGENGVLATLTGKRQKLTNASIIKAALRRPFGSLRVLYLIHWQAIKIKLKGAAFRPRPEPPEQEYSMSQARPNGQ